LLERSDLAREYETSGETVCMEGQLYERIHLRLKEGKRGGRKKKSQNSKKAINHSGYKREYRFLATNVNP